MRTDTVTVNATPTAEFSIHPDTVRLPNQALYTSNTSVGAATYEWDFGDGTIVTEEEPVHYYKDWGDFYVTLVVRSTEGCAASAPERHVRVEPEGQLKFPNAST